MKKQEDLQKSTTGHLKSVHRVGFQQDEDLKHTLKLVWERIQEANVFRNGQICKSYQNSTNSAANIVWIRENP